MVVPVLILDLTTEEADKLLATFDPIGHLAGADLTAIERLLATTEFENPAVQAVVEQIALFESGATGSASAAGTNMIDAGIAQNTGSRQWHPKPREVDVPTLFQIVVECDDETGQRELYERLTNGGYKCRVMTL